MICNESSFDSFSEGYCFVVVQLSGADYPGRSHQNGSRKMQEFE